MIGTGDVTDDDILNDMGDVALGVVTSFHYSAAHNSDVNKAYVDAFKKANPTMRPNFHGVGGYDGMQLIYKALEATKGSTNGDALIAAMKGMTWESPRGPITIDPQTRETNQNVYIRKVERVKRGTVQRRVRNNSCREGPDQGSKVVASFIATALTCPRARGSGAPSVMTCSPPC